MPPPRPSLPPQNALAVAADAQKRIGSAFRRGLPGFLGGRTEVASPVSAAAKGLATPSTRPGSGGAPLTGWWTWSDSVAVGSVVKAGSTGPWVAEHNDIGMTTDASFPGVLFFPSAGIAIVSATADFAANVTGSRYMDVAGVAQIARSEIQAVTVAARPSYLTVGGPEKVPASGDLAVNVAHYGTGASLTVEVGLRIAFWAS